MLSQLFILVVGALLLRFIGAGLLGTANAAANANAFYDVQQLQAQQASAVQRMSPQMAAAIANDPRARAAADIVNNTMGPFDMPVPAEVLRRSDVLFSQIFPLIDGSAVTAASVEWWFNTPDNVIQSEEVTDRKMDGQVDFEIREIGIHVPLNMGQENWDYLRANSTFELETTDQNLLRIPLSGGILMKQAEFDTAISASGFTAGDDATFERTLITGVTFTGITLDPTQWKLWRRSQTIKMRLRLIPGFTFPVPLTLTPGDGTTLTMILLNFGRKQTDLKA